MSKDYSEIAYKHTRFLLKNAESVSQALHR